MAEQDDKYKNTMLWIAGRLEKESGFIINPDFRDDILNFTNKHSNNAGNFSFWLIKIEDYTMNYSMSISLILRGSVPLFPSASQHLSISDRGGYLYYLNFVCL
jgi:hypothetical protein